MKDGGVVALSGFLYQLLGSAAQLAAAGDPTARLLQEPSGEDALLHVGHTSELIQFKYSTVNDSITPTNFAEILVKLESHGNDYPNASWKLVTNRLRSPGLTAIFDDRLNDPSLANVSLNTVSTITRLRDRVTWQNWTHAQTTEVLAEYAEKFGLNEENGEVTNGVHQILGALISSVHQHGPNAQFNIQLLNETLVGFPQPGVLRAEERHSEILAQLEANAGANGPTLSEVISRSALRDLLASDDSVIVVEGHGGAGKSLSVLHFLHQHASASRRLCMALLAHHDNTFMSMVAQWRRPKHEYGIAENFDVSLQRLRIANKNVVGPFVYIALDGADEDGWNSANRRDHARLLLRRALDRLPHEQSCRSLVKIIVTCRHRDEIKELIAEDGAGGLIPHRQPRVITMGDLDGEEFAKLWALWFNDLPLPVGRVTEGERIAPVDTQVLGANTKETTELGQRVTEALTNPAMLGCFRGLSNEIRRDVLAGHPQAWCELLKSYLSWFKIRVLRRHKLGEAEIESALRAVALCTQEQMTSMHDYNDKWIGACIKDGVSTSTARRLFRDAVTSGLVVTDKPLYQMSDKVPIPWRWRQPFLAEYFSSIP